MLRQKKVLCPWASPTLNIIKNCSEDWESASTFFYCWLAICECLIISI